MTIDTNTIEKLISEGIPGSSVRIEDLRGDGEHYVAYVISPSFAEKTRIQQHQMVHAALESIDQSELPALAIQTSIAEEHKP